MQELVKQQTATIVQLDDLDGLVLHDHILIDTEEIESNHMQTKYCS